MSFRSASCWTLIQARTQQINRSSASTLCKSVFPLVDTDINWYLHWQPRSAPPLFLLSFGCVCGLCGVCVMWVCACARLLARYPLTSWRFSTEARPAASSMMCRAGRKSWRLLGGEASGGGGWRGGRRLVLPTDVREQDDLLWVGHCKTSTVTVALQEGNWQQGWLKLRIEAKIEDKNSLPALCRVIMYIFDQKFEISTWKR